MKPINNRVLINPPTDRPFDPPTDRPFETIQNFHSQKCPLVWYTHGDTFEQCWEQAKPIQMVLNCGYTTPWCVSHLLYSRMVSNGECTTIEKGPRFLYGTTQWGKSFRCTGYWFSKY